MLRSGWPRLPCFSFAQLHATNPICNFLPASTLRHQHRLHRDTLTASYRLQSHQCPCIGHGFNFTATLTHTLGNTLHSRPLFSAVLSTILSAPSTMVIAANRGLLAVFLLQNRL